MSKNPVSAIPMIQRVVAILWPSFIMAGIATILITTAFDPAALFIEYDISRIGYYSICFFTFWAFGAMTATATCYFLKPCAAVNRAMQQEKERQQAGQA